MGQFLAEQQHTRAPHGHVLTNSGVWSPDGQWLVYDVRSDPAGAIFDGDRIERVHVVTGEVQRLYQARDGACCGVATCSPLDDRVVFIHGPEHPTPDWRYGPWHRRGVIVAADRPGVAINLDACDLTPPFAPGALRGGSHLHTFSPNGDWVAFTYEDHLLAQFPQAGEAHDWNQRNVGVSVPGHDVAVDRDHPRNHDGHFFSVLVTRTVNQPRPGSDEICRACEEAWLGNAGYLRADGTRQTRALAFLGEVVTDAGQHIQEVFVVDLPNDMTQPSDAGPLAGTATRRPLPPRGTVQRRLTFTADRQYPGVQGPRHWLRSSPDGTRIACLMKDDFGVVQLWTVSPLGGAPRQVTEHRSSIESAFTWSPDGRCVAYVCEGRIVVTEVASGSSRYLTPAAEPASAPRPEAVAYSPEGGRIAYVRHVSSGARRWNQIFSVALE